MEYPGKDGLCNPKKEKLLQQNAMLPEIAHAK